jgi:hypothetical protein
MVTESLGLCCRGPRWKAKKTRRQSWHGKQCSRGAVPPTGGLSKALLCVLCLGGREAELYSASISQLKHSDVTTPSTPH